METVKEKIDNVRHGRKRSKESSSSHNKPDPTLAGEVSHGLEDQEHLTRHLAEFSLNNNEEVSQQDVNKI